MSLLEVSHLKKSFGNLKAVDNVSFVIEPGEIFGLLGPNGAGKSTTMMMLAGLLPVDEGEIRLDEVAVDPTNNKLRVVLGVVPQDLAIYPELSARENLQFFGRLYGLAGQTLRERVDLALKRIGLVDRADDKAGKFSGGMKRRLNFGAALLHHPRLLILDEPTVGVDPQSRSHLLDSVRELAAEGTAVIYASHYMEEVQDICPRVAIMDHGKMIACDKVDNLLQELSSELVLRVSRNDASKSAGTTTRLSDGKTTLAERLKGLGELKSVEGDDVEQSIVLANRPSSGVKERLSLNQRLHQVLEIVTQAGYEVRSVKTHEPDLELLFLKLTGNRLRD